LEEALEFLNGPDFMPAASDPARIEFDGPCHFKFSTPRPSKVEENNIVCGRLYRCAERWHERPVIILLDGSPPIGYPLESTIWSLMDHRTRSFGKSGSSRKSGDCLTVTLARCSCRACGAASCAG
jgi:hypothetical protein